MLQLDKQHELMDEMKTKSRALHEADLKMVVWKKCGIVELRFELQRQYVRQVDRAMKISNDSVSEEDVT